MTCIWDIPETTPSPVCEISHCNCESSGDCHAKVGEILRVFRWYVHLVLRTQTLKSFVCINFFNKDILIHCFGLLLSILKPFKLAYCNPLVKMWSPLWISVYVPDYSPEWFSLQKGRVTSSMFRYIIRGGENPRSLISGYCMAQVFNISLSVKIIIFYQLRVPAVYKYHLNFVV